MLLVVHPTGNQNSRQVAKAFAERGRLAAFATALRINATGTAWKLLPPKLLQEIARRDFSEIGGKSIACAGTRELTRLLSLRLGVRKLIERERGWASIDNVYHAVGEGAAKLVRNDRRITAVYAYESGAIEVFDAAKERRDVTCIYELPAGYWRFQKGIIASELERNPGWADTIEAAKLSAAHYAQHDDELALADKIVVPSRFVEQTLQMYPGSLPELFVVPYGFPKNISEDDRHWFDGGRPLRLLFVGSLSQLKGISYMVEAVSKIEKFVTLTIIGAGSAMEKIGSYLPHVKYLGSLPHQEVLSQMRDHDVLLFPTLCDGFGMVATEGMSQGMAVIGTTHCGLPEVSDKYSAVVVPAGDGQALLGELLRMLSEPERVKSLGVSALRKAEAYQWSQYRERVSAL